MNQKSEPTFFKYNEGLINVFGGGGRIWPSIEFGAKYLWLTEVIRFKALLNLLHSVHAVVSSCLSTMDLTICI